MSQVAQVVEGWSPLSIYEPIPDRCIPEELPALRDVLPFISVLSPNSEEALRLLSLPLPPTKPLIEQACNTFLDFGVGVGGAGWVIIRSGELGAFIACRSQPGRWIDPYWTIDERVVDVTGAGNSFFGWPCRRPRIERRRCLRGYVMLMSKLRAHSRTVHTHNTTPRFDELIQRSAAFFATISAWKRLQELKARHAKNDRN